MHMQFEIINNQMIYGQFRTVYEYSTAHSYDSQNPNQLISWKIIYLNSYFNDFPVPSHNREMVVRTGYRCQPPHIEILHMTG